MAELLTHGWRLETGDYRGASEARADFRERFLRGCEVEAGSLSELLFGELVANAVRHARSEVWVFAVSDGSAYLQVIDDGECFSQDAIAPQPLGAENGRGLYIASTIAQQLQVARIGERCVVTALLPMRAG